MRTMWKSFFERAITSDDADAARRCVNCHATA
jgi:hypothetical protein